MKEVSKNVFLGSAIVASVASSLCCILPVIAIAFGLGAFGIASVFETLRPYLLIVSVAALAFGFYQTYFRSEECAEGQACSTKPVGRFNRSMLWLATVVIGAFAFFPYYTGFIVSALDRPEQSTFSNGLGVTSDGANNELSAVPAESQKRSTVVIAVGGMTCEDCATHLNIALKRIKGVINAQASYREKNVKVVYDPTQVEIERIRQGIRDAGYDPQ